MYLFLERVEGKEKERERNIHVWFPLVHPLLVTWACNPGMCPDWEPFDSQSGIQSTEPHQPRQNKIIFYVVQ